MSERRIPVSIPNHAYEIAIGERLLARAGELIKPQLASDRVIIVTDQNVAKLYLHRLTGALDAAKIRSRALIVPAGESTKSMGGFGTLMEQLLEQNPDRRTTLIALGGGVVGDITGFAASVLLRGVPFIQMPTTLLAQVDSSVGGKTGINASHGKNLIGTFYQPKMVLIDTMTLATLPPRELRAGYAEILKYGLINDAVFFHWLEEHGAALLAGDAALQQEAIARSCAAKAAIVAADEREGGVRALLNFGHTFGHALEAETGFSDTLLHGEAVAIGMIMAIAASIDLSLCAPDVLPRVLTHYRATGLPTHPHAIRREWNSEVLMQHFTRDKKAKDGALTFVLARAIGECFVNHNSDADAIKSSLEHFLTQPL